MADSITTAVPLAARTATVARRSFVRSHVPILVFVLSYLAIVFALRLSSVPMLAADLVFGAAFTAFCLSFSILVVVTFGRWKLARRGRIHGREANRRSWRVVGRVVRQKLLARPALHGFVVTLACYTVFMRNFATLKGEIGRSAGFTWDTAFMQLDRWLHLGVDPWRILHPLLGYPIVTKAVDSLYYVWFAVVILSVTWHAWQPHGWRRLQFFLALLATWALLGSAAAWAFASAGPIYYAEVTGSGAAYGELMGYLMAVNEQWGLRTFSVRELLWAGYTGVSQDLYEGIAAMPSLHVAIAVLLVLAAAGTNRTAVIAYACFAGVIVLGSVHLAWHYAVDSYFSLLATPLIWWACGRFARWYLPDDASPPPGSKRPEPVMTRAWATR
jgi:hypothetical protein